MLCPHLGIPAGRGCGGWCVSTRLWLRPGLEVILGSWTDVIADKWFMPSVAEDESGQLVGQSVAILPHRDFAIRL
jgi:hypothetical protein